MNASNRRAEIIRILYFRRHETMQALAREFSVTDRTIRRDILMLSTEYPLKTSTGRYGGVTLDYSYHPYQGILSREQLAVLIALMELADEYQRTVVSQLLREFGPPKYQAILT